MLETLANLGEFFGGIAVIASLIYIGFQLNGTRQQLRANALMERIRLRISIWQSQLDQEVLQNVQDKVFEHEIYRRDLLPHEIDELDLREVRAWRLSFLIELMYALMLFYQRKSGALSTEETVPLDYLNFFSSAPLRRQWKDYNRLTHWPADFVAHVDNIVKKYDEIERRMDSDQDADYEAVRLEVLDVPPPPPWID